MEARNSPPGDRPDSDAPLSIRAICKAIFQVEQELALLERSVANVYYWQLLRQSVLGRVARQFGLYEELASGWDLPAKLWLKLSGATLGISAYLKPGTTNFDAIYVSDALRDRRPGHALPIHAECLSDDPQIGRMIVLYRPTPRNPLFRDKSHAAYPSTLPHELGRLAGLLRYQHFMQPMHAEHRLIDAHFRRVLGIKFPFLPSEMSQIAATFVGQRRAMSNWFAHTRAPRLYIHAAYLLQYIVAAAQDVGMEVCELQHGLITPYHLGYSYPGRPRVPYAPNRLLLLGPYWRDAAELPANTDTVVIGCRYLDRYLQARVTKIPRQAVVVSQSAIGRRLFDATMTFARTAPGWQFVFRPHPQEDAEGYNGVLSDRGDIGNLRISERSEDFSMLLAESEVQIGAFSTGLFEGMIYGARTIVLALPGVEYMHDTIARGDAVLAQAAEDVPALLDTAPSARNPEKYYSPPVPSVSAALRSEHKDYASL